MKEVNYRKLRHTLIPTDNDCVPPRQYLSSRSTHSAVYRKATERFLSRPLVCGTVFHLMSPRLHLSLALALVSNLSLFLIPVALVLPISIVASRVV